MSVHLGSQAASHGALVGRVVDDFVAALDRGEQPQVEDFAGRYPEIGEILREVLTALEFVRAARPSAERQDETPVDDTPFSGTLGDFHILREVGRGGMGVVYEAEQISLGRRVALKVLPFAAALDARQLQRFKNEAQAAAGLHHTNIVPVYYVGSDRCMNYYAMQYIDGQTLAQMIAQLRRQVGEARKKEIASGPSPPPAPGEATAPFGVPARAGGSPTPKPGRAETFSTEQSARDPSFFRTVASLGIQAAQALEHAHQLGVIHRDIKPGNLLIEHSPLTIHHSPPRLWITDFGLAHCRSQAGLTMTGDLVGTLRYMSPEQALAKRVTVDHRTDIYSLGATLYELLTLQPAFPGGDREELLRQIAFEEPQPPRRLNKAVPAELETIVLKALEKNPVDRFATAQELADDLERFLEDRPIQARRPTLAKRLSKWGRRNRPAVLAAGAILTAVGFLFAVHWAMAAQQRAERRHALGTHLEQARDLQKLGRWTQARAALERAESRLEDGDPQELHDGLEQVRANLVVVAELEEIPPRMTALPEGHFDHAAADKAYRETFRKYGLEVETLDSDDAAERIKATPIKDQLLAGLDRWALVQRKAAPAGWQRLVALARRVDPDPLRDQVRRALLSRDREALANLARGLDVYALPAATANLLGAVLRDAKEVRLAVDVLQQAQRRHPDDIWINLGLADGLMALEPARAAEAVSYYRAMLAVRPDSPGGRVSLGNALHAQRDLAGAAAEYLEALRINPALAMAHNNLGGIRSEQGNLPEAEAELRQALALEPDFAVAYGNLGGVFVKQEKWAEAETVLRAGILHQPDYPQLHYLLGQVLSRQHKFGAAVAALREGLGLEKGPRDPIALHDLGEALADQGKYAEAEPAYREAIARKPNFYNAYNSLGNVLWRLGKFPEAEDACRKAIGINRQGAQAHYNLGVALCKQHRLAEGEAALREAVRLDPNDAAAHNGLGLALVEEGQADEAETELRAALCLKRDLVLTRFYLASLLAGRGKYLEAAAEFEEGLRQQPDAAAAHLDLGRVYARAGQWHKAVKHITMALEQKSDLPGARFDRAYAYTVLAQWDNAADDLAPSDLATAPPNKEFWFQLACLRLLGGDLAGYRQLCKKLVERIALTKEAFTGYPAFLASRTCTLRPEGSADPLESVRWAQEGLVKRERAPYCLFALALAEYRAGQLDHAIQHCHASLEAGKDWRGKVLNWLLLAMAEQRRGHRSEAQQYLAKTAHWKEQATRGMHPAGAAFPPDMSLSDWLHFQVLSLEAEALFGPGKRSNGRDSHPGHGLLSEAGLGGSKP
jgi:serine/threonine protein kinase/Flp pilus assembly protein TadD